VELFHVNRWWRIRLCVAENPGSPFKELIPPSLNDIRVDWAAAGLVDSELS
jgi:hypothetical protein